MNFFRKKQKPVPVEVDQGPLSVFEYSPEPVVSAPEAEDLDFIDVTGTLTPRDDDAPFGPELPEHVVAPRERRRRRIRFGGVPVRAEPASLVEEVLPEAAPVAAPAKEDVLEGADQSFDTPVLTPEVEAAPEVKAKKGFFNRSKNKKGAKAADDSDKLDKKSKGKLFSLKKKSAPAVVHNLPIRVLIGYMPEVSEKDALGFALGVADKHLENIELAHYDAFRFANGFVYEVHEGGSGHAFVPGILEHFDSLGPYRSDGDVRMHIRTSTRIVEVTRKDQGLESVLLPESASVPDTVSPEAGPLMRPAMNQRKGLLVAGAAMFITGTILAFVIGLFMRLVPVDEVMAPKAEEIRSSETPAGQWSTRLQNVPEGKYVKALRYDKAAGWRVENGDISQEQNQPAGN